MPSTLEEETPDPEIVHLECWGVHDISICGILKYYGQLMYYHNHNFGGVERGLGQKMSAHEIETLAYPEDPNYYSADEDEDGTQPTWWSDATYMLYPVTEEECRKIEYREIRKRTPIGPIPWWKISSCIRF
jgi:hypothetical protein